MSAQNSISAQNLLTGKSILLTGATGGIGRVTARMLAGAGANLVLHGNQSRETLDCLTTELRGQGIMVEQIVADLTDEKERHFLVPEAFRRMERLNTAVFAAGTDLMAPECKSMTFTQRMEHLFRTDVMGTIEPARCFAEILCRTQSRGTMILFGWDGVVHGMDGDTAQLYALAKGAVQGIVKSLAKSYAPHVRVLCVAPGWITTTWGEKAGPEIRERLADDSFSRRWGTPKEVAALIRFLVSEDASYLNAEIIPLNGGR